MTVNRFCLTGFVLFSLSAAPAFAADKQGEPAAPEPPRTAPALYHAEEIQVQHGRLGDTKASANCGVSPGEVGTVLTKALLVDSLPAFFVLDAPKPLKSVERINLFPDVITIQPRENTCVSWVGLSAQSRAALLLPPVEEPRDLIVTYWQGGLMVSSVAASHFSAVKEALSKLAGQFSRQYKLDQGPNLNPPTAPAAATVQGH